MTKLNPYLANQRLQNQHIRGGKFASPEAVVCWMGAMQAQDYGQAVWAVATRTQNATLADVEQAIAEGKIICTWTMRGTIHFVSPENALWMLRLFATRILKSSTGRLAQLGLDEATLARCHDICLAVLEGGRVLTREELLATIEAAGISTEKQRGYHILTQLAQRGLICQGARQGKQQTFALFQEWVPSAEDLEPEAAYAKLARLYFASHGPATEYDLAWWVGTTLTDVRGGIAAAGDDLICQTIDGQKYYTAQNHEATSPEASIYLLPGYDEYILGYKERGAVLAGDDLNRIVPGNNGVFRPMLVIDGQILGTWIRTLKKACMEVTLKPFIELSTSQVAIARVQAEAYATFHGLPLALKIA